MFLRVLELCLTVIFLAVTIKEIILPLMRDTPLFPTVRKTFFNQPAGKDQE